jgi:hypothetical protein
MSFLVRIDAAYRARERLDGEPDEEKPGGSHVDGVAVTSADPSDGKSGEGPFQGRMSVVCFRDDSCSRRAQGSA